MLRQSLNETDAPFWVELGNYSLPSLHSVLVKSRQSAIILKAPRRQLEHVPPSRFDRFLRLSIPLNVLSGPMLALEAVRCQTAKTARVRGGVGRRQQDRLCNAVQLVTLTLYSIPDFNGGKILILPRMMVGQLNLTPPNFQNPQGT